MFLRKLTVILLPLLLVALLCLILPVLSTQGFLSGILIGALLGALLALLLPLSGASRLKEPFAFLLWIPAATLCVVVFYQYLAGVGLIHLPLLRLLETRDPLVLLVESTFAAYMVTQSIRTRGYTP